MPIYAIFDSYGRKSIHRCNTPEIAYQLHLFHHKIDNAQMLFWFFSDEKPCNDFECEKYNNFLKGGL